MFEVHCVCDRCGLDVKGVFREMGSRLPEGWRIDRDDEEFPSLICPECNNRPSARVQDDDDQA